MDRKGLEISWSGLWKVLFFIVLVAIMYAGLNVLLGLFLAIVISSGLEFLVNFLEKRGLPRTLGVIMIFLAAALILVLVVSIVLPLLVIDLNTALINLNKIAKDSWWGDAFGIQASQGVSAIISGISDRLFSGDNSPFGALSSIVGNVALTISIVISSFYLSLSRDGVERFIRAVFPATFEDSALKIYERSRRRIGYWFRSQILLSLTMGLLVTISLLVVGVKYAILLGILAGIFELVPFVGPILAGSAAVISALTVSPVLALYTLIIFVALHQIESHFLVPMIVGRSVGLHPVIVIVALLVGVEVGGFMGILISVPAAVVLQEIIEGWSGKKSLREVSLPL